MTRVGIIRRSLNLIEFNGPLYNILNNDGKLIVIDFDKNETINHPKVHNGFSHEELKKTLSEVGFQSTEIQTFYHGNRIFMSQDASMFISSSIK